MALSGPLRTLQQVAEYLLTKLGISFMFADPDWMFVAEATEIPFRNHVPNRQELDSKWATELENILNEQVMSDVIPLNTRVHYI